MIAVPRGVLDLSADGILTYIAVQALIADARSEWLEGIFLTGQSQPSDEPSFSGSTDPGVLGRRVGMTRHRAKFGLAELKASRWLVDADSGLVLLHERPGDRRSILATEG